MDFVLEHVNALKDSITKVQNDPSVKNNNNVQIELTNAISIITTLTNIASKHAQAYMAAITMQTMMKQTLKQIE